jgi:enterochelin esterase family protein
MRRGRVETPLFQSEVLRGNPMGDPAARTVPVYLPPSYDEDAGRRYPVVVVLSGFTGRGAMQLNDALWVEPLDRRMDRLVGEGCPEAILVLPDCSTRLGGSQYVDSTATGRYEEHVARELVAWVDMTFRTLPGARAVVGKSSGGFGVLSLLLRRPGVFRAGACHSGDAYFEYCYARDFADVADFLDRRGGLLRFLEEFPKLQNKSKPDVMKALNVVAMASCYSPDPAAPAGFVLPFFEKTGEIREEIWRRWLAFDPVRLVDSRADALRGCRLLYLDCGTKDEFALHLGARILSQRLRAFGVPHEHEEFEDGHFNIQYRMDVSLPRVIRAIS